MGLDATRVPLVASGRSFTMKNKYTKVRMKAMYKGHEVFLYSKNNINYNACYLVRNENGIDTSWMLNMRNVGKGEYHGEIPLDDPELELIQNESEQAS